ncbi:MAG: ABC transporter ATP-binding protein [Gammaproteobacteria bacterium]|nr:ABC transporter ATP-binding protein [Gammaproteobacteria bacterium]
MLKCENLGIRVTGRTLVRDLSLELRPGEVVCMLGPNGVGKTLTLHTLAGLLPPASGRIWLDGEDLGTLGRRQVARRLGLLLQDEAESFPATVADTVLMGRHPHLGAFAGASAADQALVDHAMAEMELNGFGPRAVGTLSGGERRRVAIARLLAQNPAILLLDEPVNHLDPRHQVLALQAFRRRASQGAVVLMSLHDSALAMRHADRALLLHADGSWQLGDTSSVLTGSNLERLFDTPYRPFTGPGGASALLPG